jgi:hypothetical protein
VYRRPLQTNEPINDRAIATDVEVSVIAAIGPLNSRKEANAHATPDRTAGESATALVSVGTCSVNISISQLFKECKQKRGGNTDKINIKLRHVDSGI